MFSIVDSCIYGNVVYGLGVVLLLPAWILLYLLCWSGEEQQEPEGKQEEQEGEEGTKKPKKD